jgi:hypothetical protein
MMEKVEQIHLLSWPQFSHYWDQIAACLGTTDFDQYYSREWLLQSVQGGSVQVWALSDGTIRLVVFTRLYDCPRGKVLQLFWGAGQDLDRFLDMANETMDRVAGVLQATIIEIIGRRGWVRKMRKYGFETEMYTISRPVGRGRVN